LIVVVGGFHSSSHIHFIPTPQLVEQGKKIVTESSCGGDGGGGGGCGGER
jgi:hypothetical protein